MKHALFSLLFFCALFMLILGSCKKDKSEKNTAILSLWNADGTENNNLRIKILPNQNVTATIKFLGTVNNTAKSIAITPNILPETSITTEQDTLSRTFDFSSSQAKVVNAQAIAYSTRYPDAVTLDFSIVITDTQASGEQTIGNQANEIARFWSCANKQSYTIYDALNYSNDVDWAYVTNSSSSGGNKIISPNSDEANASYNSNSSPRLWEDEATSIDLWTVRNATQFRKASQIASSVIRSVANGFYDELIATELAAGEPTLSSVSISGGDVIFFKTALGKYGFIIVKSCDGTIGSNGLALTGALTFEAYYHN